MQRSTDRPDGWAKQVNRIMQRDWCIGVADAGLDDTDLARYWKAGDTPQAFVAWFAEKHDLIRFER